MKHEDISDALNLLDDDMIRHTERIRKKMSKRIQWQKWAVAAACLWIVYIIGVSFSYIFQKPHQASPSKNNILPVEQEDFVSISSLLAENNSDLATQIEETSIIPIGQYIGIYIKIPSVESSILSKSIGKTVFGKKEWYYVSGHTDLQYLIQNDNNKYSLWKFKCFDSDEYLYSEVLKLVYQIDSADKITKIQVNPATMDNTDFGKSIQAEIGTYTVTNKNEIETIYQILSSLTCYGENHWDIIDYGNVEAADGETSSSEAVLLGRYLTLVTNYGNEIDSLKYTAVSNMFYEFSGIAYNKLTKKQADTISKILHIKEPKKIKQLPRKKHNNSSLLKNHSNETTADSIGKTQNANITLKYITQLQRKISNAMINQELPFVSSSSVYENPYRLHIVVSSNSEKDLAKLKAFDTIGGALEIEYNKNSLQNFW